jgi:hypothetical protein
MRIIQQAVEHWELIVRASSGSGLDVTVASFPLRDWYRQSKERVTVSNGKAM